MGAEASVPKKSDDAATKLTSKSKENIRPPKEKTTRSPSGEALKTTSKQAARTPSKETSKMSSKETSKSKETGKPVKTPTRKSKEPSESEQYESLGDTHTALLAAEKSSPKKSVETTVTWSAMLSSWGRGVVSSPSIAPSRSSVAPPTSSNSQTAVSLAPPTSSKSQTAVSRSPADPFKPPADKKALANPYDERYQTLMLGPNHEQVFGKDKAVLEEKK